VFDEQFFSYLLMDQLIYGYHSNVSSLEQQILYHNMPNATLEDIAKDIQTKAVPHNTKWTPSTLLQIPGAFETDIPDPVENGTPQAPGYPR
jgi:hypothetical protein